LPGLQSTCKFLKQDWLLHILGEINHDKAKNIVKEIKEKYPDKQPEEIAHQIILNHTLEAAKLGLIANIIPPVALILMGFELTAITKLQSEMVSQLAVHYNLDLQHPSRRGENLAIFGLSLGGDALKIPLGFMELLPGLGALVGASSNAITLYCLGLTTAQLYQYKLKQK
jgi:uncharacterized protein (DUF697 family)